MNDSKATSASISVFFPAFNDGENMKVQVPRTVETLRQVANDFEVIVVDDGSSDGTLDVLQELQKRFPFLQVVRHEFNRGYGAALQSGFAHATKEMIFYTDGDGQYDVADLPLLLEKMAPGVDMVMGFKVRRADSAHRSIVGSVYKHSIKFLFGLKVKDVDCDFRLIRRRVMDTVSLTSRTGAVCVDLMCQIERAGFLVMEVPVNHHERLHGQSQFFRVGPVARTLADVCRLWFKLILFKRRPPRGASKVTSAGSRSS